MGHMFVKWHCLRNPRNMGLQEIEIFQTMLVQE